MGAAFRTSACRRSAPLIFFGRSGRRAKGAPAPLQRAGAALAARVALRERARIATLATGTMGATSDAAFPSALSGNRNERRNIAHRARVTRGYLSRSPDPADRAVSAGRRLRHARPAVGGPDQAAPRHRDDREHRRRWRIARRGGRRPRAAGWLYAPARRHAAACQRVAAEVKAALRSGQGSRSDHAHCGRLSGLWCIRPCR